jgi:glycosyltransferase involved in cell wall biosynthesis
VIAPGRLSDQELAAKLAASDIFLAPLIDGVTTRRTSVMAALQHGLPVVGTDGPLTDDDLRQASGALTLIPLGDVGRFAQAVVALAQDRSGRLACSRASLELYETRFSWPVLAKRFAGAVEVEAACRQDRLGA